MTRFYGVFAPNSQHRTAIINKKNNKKQVTTETRTEREKPRAMTWTSRLKRAFNIDIKTCEACGGAAKVIACIDDPVVINKILGHIKAQQDSQFMRPVNRAPPASFSA